MTSILRGTGALLLCAAVASQAMADDRASPASVANAFVDALQQQRFDEAAVMFSPETKRDGSAWADALRRLGAELGGFSMMRPVAKLPEGRSIRLEIPAEHGSPTSGRRFVQLRYASTAADDQAVFYELNLSADERPRLLSLALHLPTPDAPSAQRARALLDRLKR